MAESCRRVLEIEIPPEVVQQRAAAIAAQFQRRARLPGFRPGKAPLAVVERRFREDILSQLIQELVPEYVQAHVKENRWELIGTPAVSDVQYAADTALKFKATLEVLPEIKLRDYRSLRAEMEEPVVSEEEVAKSLEHLREQSATYVNVEARPLQDGDYASISMQGTSPGKQSPGVELGEVLCEIGGPNTVKEFTENLRGAPAGEERSFEVAYPREFSDPRLAGNTISYRVKVLGIKKKQLPELNDELARELGEFDSLEAVRQRVREDLSRAKRRDAVDEAKKRLRRELVELHDFPVPDLLVERQLDRRMERLRRQIASQGVNLQTLDVDWGKVRGSQREAALEDVKSSLILERIAEQESVDVQEEELEREIEKLAAATNQPAPALRARLTREGTLDKIKSTLRVEKALELVLHHATGSVSGVGSTGAGSLG